MIQLSHIAKNLLLESKIRPGVDFVFQQNPELSEIGTPEQYSAYLDTIFPNSKIKDIVYHGTYGTWYKKEKFKHNVGVRTTDSESRKFGHWFASSPKVTELFNTIDLKQLYQEIEQLGFDPIKQDKLFDELQKAYRLTDEEVGMLTDSLIKYMQEESQSWGPHGYTPPKVTRYSPYISKTVAAVINAERPVYADTKTFAGSTRASGHAAFEYLQNLNSDIVILPQLHPDDFGPGSDEWEHGTHYAVRKADDIHILGSEEDIESFKKFVENL